MTLGCALLVIFAVYLIDKNGKWKEAMHVLGWLTACVSIGALGIFAWVQYTAYQDERERKAVEAASEVGKQIPPPPAGASDTPPLPAAPAGFSDTTPRLSSGAVALDPLGQDIHLGQQPPSSHSRAGKIGRKANSPYGNAICHACQVTVKTTAEVRYFSGRLKVITMTDDSSDHGDDLRILTAVLLDQTVVEIKTRERGRATENGDAIKFDHDAIVLYSSTFASRESMTPRAVEHVETACVERGEEGCTVPKWLQK